MKPIKTLDELSREELVSVCLRKLALKVDPRYGRLSELAKHLGLHVNTLHLWISNGAIPMDACRRLRKEFGPRHVNIEQLVCDA